MTALTRKTQKVFAGNANADQIAIMGTMKTGTPQYSGDVAALQSAEYELGWADAILSDKAPFLEEMNGVQYGFSYQLAYLLQEGIAEWDSATEYKANSFCKVNNTIYYSLQNDNVNHSVTNTAWWGVVGDSRFVKRSGDTMTGALTLPSLSPTENSLKAATTRFVRQWAYGKVVRKNYFIINLPDSVSVKGSSSVGYNLGTQPSGNPYLPSDYSDYPYEVLVTVEGKTGTTVGDYMNIAFESALVGALDCAKAKCVVSGKVDLCSWTGWIPISNGALWLVRSTEWTGSIVKLVIRGYRRLN